MNEQDLLRIVRNILSSAVDLVDSSSNEKTLSAVLLNVRNGVEGFVSLLDEVILDDTISDVEGLKTSPRKICRVAERARCSTLPGAAAFLCSLNRVLHLLGT